MERSRVLGVAAASGRVGYVFLVDKKLYSYSLSRRAAESAEDAARFAKAWIDRMRPGVLVTEKLTERSRKGEAVRSVIESIARIAANEALYDIAVVRPRKFPNKFAEANALANHYPELRRRLPEPRKLWNSEPRNVTIFEALALALEVIDREDGTIGVGPGAQQAGPSEW